MLPKLQFHLTNWVDGMKINRQHFIDSENALLDRLRDATATSLQAFNYGLVQPLSGESSLDCTASFSQARKFRIVVTYCRAITAGGCRIEIIPGVHPELTSDNDIFPDSDGYGAGKPATGNYFAIISVDLYNRQPFGAAAAEEYPPRNMHSVPAFKLSLVAEENIDPGSLGAFHLSIAKFVLKGGELIRDAAYIPPCSVIGAHPGAWQIYTAIDRYLNQVQEFSTQIVHKVVEGAQTAALAQNIRKICEHSIRHISSESFFFRTMYRRQSPVFMANTVVQLASLISVCINLMSLKEKEELLQYFCHWSDIAPGRFEELLATVINAEYNHEDIYRFYQPLLALLKIWTDLLATLKDLNLLGQKKQGFDLVAITSDTPKDKGKGKFSIFD